MAVDDYGLEVLKKSGEQVTPGDKSNHYIKTGNIRLPLLEIAVGNIPGYRPVFKFGRRVLTTTTIGPMWSGATTISWPTTATVISLVSDNANDTAAGTGARTVLIQYLDANWDEQEETLTLSGVTPVTTTGTALRINRMYITTAGSTRTNAGLLTASIGGVIIGRIEIGRGQTEQAFYSVPSGHTFFLNHWAVSVESAKIMRANIFRRVGSTDRYSDTVLTNNFVEVTVEVYNPFDEMSDVVLLAQSTSGTSESSGYFHGILRTNTS